MNSNFKINEYLFKEINENQFVFYFLISSDLNKEDSIEIMVANKDDVKLNTFDFYTPDFEKENNYVFKIYSKTKNILFSFHIIKDGVESFLLREGISKVRKPFLNHKYNKWFNHDDLLDIDSNTTLLKFIEDNLQLKFNISREHLITNLPSIKKSMISDKYCQTWVSKEIDFFYSSVDQDFGASYKNKKWFVRLWQPFAKKVNLILFDKNDHNQEIGKINGRKDRNDWVWEINQDYESYYYQFEIVNFNGVVNIVLDPYAKSMAPFNWEDNSDKVGKASFVKVNKSNKLFVDEKNVQPIIYEAHVRDLTSKLETKSRSGTFNAIIEQNLGKYLKSIGITHIQFLPLHQCFALDETSLKILKENEGGGWTTNYNWGYDPQNYFSLNGWYSSNVFDPYSRVVEFQNLVQHFHDNGIKVIVDVVYNHSYTYKTFENIISGYFFRANSKLFPVIEPPIASEHLMVRKLIIESLLFMVETYDVDGFRFDLLGFMDQKTIKLLANRLRNLKPNILLHGEAWNYTDLIFTNSFVKGDVDNEIGFAYFNDTARDSILGQEDEKSFIPGLVSGNNEFFKSYIATIFGNATSEMLKKNNLDFAISSNYDNYTNYLNNNLNYAACHDGHTFWDKVNLTVEGPIDKKIEAFRQALVMNAFLPGQLFYLQGTEILDSKPNDYSGMDYDRYRTNQNVLDLFSYDTKELSENSYRTTDFVNGISWNSLSQELKSKTTNFFKAINNFRINSETLNQKSTKGWLNSIKLNSIDYKNLIIDFNLLGKSENLRIIHNFGETKYPLKHNLKVIFNTNLKGDALFVLPHSSIVAKK